MSKSKYKRKLTAILSADVVGYSRLMGDDEEFTIQTLNAYRDLMTKLIEDYSGSVVDAGGDNLLAEFTSVVDAVQCSVAIQTQLKKKNEKISVSRHMLFRIGINVGDIIQEKGRIYGDGVNIAARIESLTEPGGVCVSRGAYDHIKKKLGFGYEYIGEHAVKNISDPVRVYKVLMDTKDAGRRIKEVSVPPAKKRQLKKWLSRVSVLIILILSTIFAGFYWKYIYLPAPADIDPDTKMEFNFPTGPSIAVLPFVNMSKDPEQEYLCDGITENIIAALAQTKQFIVIARNSTFAYKNKSINVQQIGQELGARNLIEGSIQKLDDRYRFVVQLIDTETEAHIWAERYDREAEDIFNLQDEITLEILKAVRIKLTDSWLEGITKKGIGDINSFIKFQKVSRYILNPTKGGYASALKNTEEIITANPEFSSGYAQLSFVYISAIYSFHCEPVEVCMLKATEAVNKALSLDEDNWYAHQALGWIFLIKKEHVNAIVSFKKVIEINPNFPAAYWAIGNAFNDLDQPLKGLENIKIAIRLDPVAQQFYSISLGISYMKLKQYENAIKIFSSILKRQPDNWMASLYLAITYDYSGQPQNAKTTIKNFLNLRPNFSIKNYKVMAPKNQDQFEKAVKALRKAGLPE